MPAKIFNKKEKQFHIDCTQPASDNLVHSQDLAEFLSQKIKCSTGKKEELLGVSSSGCIVEVRVTGEFIGKQGVKYQTRRFLHARRLKAFVKVLADGKEGLKLQYTDIESNKEE